MECKDVDRMDLETLRWESLRPLMYPRADPAVVVSRGKGWEKLYILGGARTNDVNCLIERYELINAREERKGDETAKGGSLLDSVLPFPYKGGVSHAVLVDQDLYLSPIEARAEKN